QLQADGFRTAPGELGEQIVLSGLDSASLTAGVRLRLGETAVIEFINPRTGCSRFEHIQGRSKAAVAGKLGFMARVILGGEVSLGDQVLIETHPDELTSET